ncbi:MAG: hypothetical protein RMY62_007780 [Nostoc sp. ZfuVER08]|uniref:Uncharacterized protein n=1 Tax=Nostoc punctiforme FACHB-252 TaxID=1357509 RepID=A0ABR8HJH8_NOSPU|nr:hypothetical protein [Nostoc punctiforme]MBD2615541.1 hypothetical protein [Nostoc punctiforme FACHB-252]
MIPIKRKPCQVEQIPVSSIGGFLRPGYLVILRVEIKPVPKVIDMAG